jgi:beta-glucanase (GH16 family)
MQKFFSALAVLVFLLLIALMVYQENALLPVSDPPVVQTTPRETEPPAPPAAPTAPTETEPPQTSPTEPKEETLFFAVAQAEAYNQELQQYVTEQTQIDGSLITLTAIKDGTQFFSGKAESKVAFRYGTFAFRIHTVKNQGLFPAIWMLPIDADRYPEVDIYEMVGNKPGTIHCGIHFAPYDYAKHFFSHRLDQEQVDGSYVLKFVWSEEKLEWYVDDGLIGTIDYNVPDIPMYLICNLAIGGSWAGYPPESSLPAVFQLEVVQFEPVEIFAR